VRRAVEPIQQELRRALGEVKERKQVEAHSHLFRFIEAGEELALTATALFANGRHDLHSPLEPRRARPTQDFGPQLHEPPQEQKVPPELSVVAREELPPVAAQPETE